MMVKIKVIHSYNNFTSRAKVICSILLKNNILSYYSKALMHLCKTNTLQA